MIDFQRAVFCTFQFEAYHRCPACICKYTDEYYLQYVHRHIFHVRAYAPVKHDNRDIEFINLKHKLENFCKGNFHQQDIGVTSCEMIAETLLHAFPELQKVEVSEDDENGAVIWRNDCQYIEAAKKHEDDLR